MANNIEGAINCVIDERLIEILSHFRLPSALVSTIQSFLTRPTISIRIDGEIEDPAPFQAGLPQRSPLSPVVFILYAYTISAVHRNLATETC